MQDFNISFAKIPGEINQVVNRKLQQDIAIEEAVIEELKYIQKEFNFNSSNKEINIDSSGKYLKLMYEHKTYICIDEDELTKGK